MPKIERRGLEKVHAGSELFHAHAVDRARCLKPGLTFQPAARMRSTWRSCCRKVSPIYDVNSLPLYS